ncbi:MAG TPA: NADPH:quinone reductase [Capsulimonadaceae bacterium]|nr:NADPH:quinone reductase [Capsulimonadaceae bacterium]
MKAIRVHEFGGPEVLKLEDVPDPTPDAGQVVVQIKAVGVNPVETYVRTGKYTSVPPLPYTPGTDAAGVVESVGAGVAGIAPGDRVWVTGTLSGAYAQKALCDRTQVHPLPEKLSFAQGAAVNVPAAAAWRALFPRGRAQAAEWVLVHGATGAVGVAAIQLARAAGLTVIGTASDDRGKQFIREQGANHAADHGDVEGIKKLSPDGKGVQLILEMLANVNLADDLAMLTPRGRVVVIGSRGKIEIDPRMVMTGEKEIRGMSVPNATPEERQAMNAALQAALEEGVLRPVVSKEMPLAEASKAHEEVIGSHAPGKIVLTP